MQLYKNKTRRLRVKCSLYDRNKIIFKPLHLTVKNVSLEYKTNILKSFRKIIFVIIYDALIKKIVIIVKLL